MLIDAPADSCEVAESWARPAPELISAFDGWPAATVGDAGGRFGLLHSGIRAQWKGARCVGTALTVLTREGDNLAIHRALDEAQPGDVLVVNGRGDEVRAIFGEVLARICIARGVVGVVLDGATRDTDAIEKLGLPIWARARTPAGPTKTGPGVVGATISVGGVVVNPGDIMVADSDGVAVVARQNAESTLERLKDIQVYESDLMRRIG